MKIGIDLGSHFIKASRLSLEGFPMAIQDNYSKLNYGFNCLEKVENGFLIGYDYSNSALYTKFKLDILKANDFKDQAHASWSKEVLLALILKKIKGDIDTIAVDSVIFATPIGLNEAQKGIIYNAAKLAEINQCSLIDAPLAAVFHHRTQQYNTVLVLDWGFTGLKITIVRKEKGTNQIVNHLEVKDIGGNAMTQRLTEIILINFEKRFGYALSQFRDKAVKVAENLKIDLSSNEYASQDIIIDSELVNITIARQAFEESIRTYLDMGVDAIKKSIDKSGYNLNQIDTAILTGGCMSVPYVKKHLKTAFTKIKIWNDNEPLLAIAMGASAFNNNLTFQRNVDLDSNEFSQQKSLVKNTAVNGII